MYDAVAIGELLIDFMVERQLDDGYPVMAARPGGAPANFLAALSKFGRKTGMISKVGDDALGRRLVATAEEVGIDTRGIVVSGDVFTTLAFVTRDRQGEREFSFARKPGADTTLSASEVDFSLIDETRVLHFGTVGMTDEPSRTAHRDAVVYASEKGKLITFDPNLRRPLWRSLDDAREQMLWGFDYADVVKVSDSEIAFLFGCSVEEGARILLERHGVSLVFVTLGKDGCYFCNPQGSGSVHAPSGIRVVDTTGAGDIFFGSAVHGLLDAGERPGALQVEALRRIAAFSCAAASLSTEKAGGIGSVPDLDTVRKAVCAG